MIDMTIDQIDQLLETCHIGRLCMADADGKPYAIPLPFCWHDGSLYLRLPLTGRKGQVLRANDRVCFEVDRFTDTLDDYASVLIEGRLIEVGDADEKLRVKQLNERKYTGLRRGHRPGHGRATPLGDLPMRKIVVETVTGRCKQATVAALTLASVS
jgi:hypothetical protein